MRVNPYLYYDGQCEEAFGFYHGVLGGEITHMQTHEEASEAERIFGALAEGGKIHMPMTQTFWAERFGMCEDRYGIPWILNGNLAEEER